MKQILVSLILILSISIVDAQQDTVSILFIGNSYTHGNTGSYNGSIPYKFEQLAISAGLNVYVEMHAPSGIYFYDDGSNAGHAYRTDTENLINSRDWDYIFAQDNQGGLLWSEGYLPSNQYDATIVLYNKIKANNSCTRLILYAGQALEGGLPSNYWNSGGLSLTSDNTQACNERIYRNVVYMNNLAGFNEIVAPVSRAWNRVTDEEPSIDLFLDGYHPSSSGTYLSAAVVFSQVFRMSPVDLQYDGGLSTLNAEYLRTVAYETVNADSTFLETHLADYTIDLSLLGSELSSANIYSNYQWYINNTEISGANSNMISIFGDSLYYLKADNSQNCPVYSFRESYTITDIKTENYSDNNFVLYPNPSNGEFTIKGGSIKKIEVFDFTGKIIKNISNLDVDLAPMSIETKGVYLIKITTKHGIFNKKIIIN